ncbi:CapA family protein [Candidatus Kaiserbacteria bacterium]|nr:CapA family protein [Candidatus Kaiserbacteria bacterium]
MKLFFVLNYFALFILILQLGAIRPHIVPPTFSYGLVGEKSILDRPVPSQVREPARFVFASAKPEAVVFVGDILLARNVEYLMEQQGSAYPFSGLSLSSLAHEPYIVGNFEAAVPDEHQQTAPLQIRFSVAESYISSLRDAHFTHLSLANNHSYDYGARGYLSTVHALQAVDVTTFGHPTKLLQESVSFLDLEKDRIALISLHTLEKQPTDADLKELFSYAASESTFQVVYVHWGEEYNDTNSKAQRMLAERLVAVGADLIIGHHPHVVQNVDLIDGVPIFYSLGNYIFDQYFATDVQIGLVVQLAFDDVPRLHVLPVTSIESLSQPRLMSAADHATFLEVLADRSHDDLREFLIRGEIPLDIPVASSPKMAMMSK